MLDCLASNDYRDTALLGHAAAACLHLLPTYPAPTFALLPPLRAYRYAQNGDNNFLTHCIPPAIPPPRVRWNRCRAAYDDGGLAERWVWSVALWFDSYR